MTTANKLTLCRVVMIPIFIVLLYQDFTHHLLAALGVFILASITDFVDGYVARHYNQVTDFGKFMDPLADKLLVMSAMAWFVQAGWMAAWAFFIVIARELAVTGLRLVAVEQGRVIAAAKSGKVKTASTMVCICLMLLLSNAATLRLDHPAHDHLLRHRVFHQKPRRAGQRGDVTPYLLSTHSARWQLPAGVSSCYNQLIFYLLPLSSHS